MKFAHFADVHVGSWRDIQFHDLSTQVFSATIDKCISEKVDFVLLAGDLFNTSHPNVQHLKQVTRKLFELSTKEIPCYIIPGSHDFSPSGRTMIDVLEAAGLVINVMKGSVEDGVINLQFVTDKKTGAKITGIIGKKGMLDRQYYEVLNRGVLEAENGFKIFMWHTAIEEFKPKGLEKMEAMPLSFFPKGFNYYAGGHIHQRLDESPEGHGRITLPGSLFPVNFDELEKYGHGGMYIYDSSREGDPLSWEPIKLFDVRSFTFDCEGKTAQEVTEVFFETIGDSTFENTLITLRFKGTLDGAKMVDMEFRRMFKELYDRGAKAIAKNTLYLSTREFEELKVSLTTVEELEKSLVREHASSTGEDREKEILQALSLMKSLDTYKLEGENVSTFERRILDEAKSTLRK